MSSSEHSCAGSGHSVPPSLNCLSAQQKQSRQAAVASIPDIQAPIRQAPKRTVRNHHELMEFPPTRVHSPLGCIKAAPSENVS